MIQETFIREIKINYKKTKTKLFQIKEPKSAINFIQKSLPDNSREHCVALYLDGANQVISYSLISTGTANYSVASPREIFQRGLVAGAISLIFAHNHPSGNTQPSEEDRSATRRLKESGDLIGIKLLDHIIVSNSGFYSFKDEGYI